MREMNGNLGAPYCWNRVSGLIAALATVSFLSSKAVASTNDPGDAFATPLVQLRPVESIKLEKQDPMENAEATRIKGLVRNLSNIETNEGWSFSEFSFAPTLTTSRDYRMMLKYREMKQSAPVVELVKLGPNALPYLLDALDDQTPTKFVAEHHDMIGGMWFSDEMQWNPANVVEAKVLDGQPKNPFEAFQRLDHKKNLSSYRVKVGDVCFEIIGQIVGRHYEAVRYQMTNCKYINSPTHDTNLVQRVRSIWSSPNPAQHLLDSLLLDFATRGLSITNSPGLVLASRLQTRAATRLLYYYPQQTTNLIVQRLRHLDIGTNSIERNVTNGLGTTEFIDAIAWSKEPAIRAELQRVLLTTADPEILRAAIMATEASNEQKVRNRVEDFISQLTETDWGSLEGRELLLASGWQFGKGARPTFEHYMRNANLQRRLRMCEVLEEVCGDLSVDLLSPLLPDTRPADEDVWTYPVVPNKDEPRLPVRVCDVAAEVISKNFPRLSFKMQGTHKELDQQIQKMREQIARHDY